MTITGEVEARRRRVSKTHTFTRPRPVDSMIATIEDLTPVPADQMVECAAESFATPTVEMVFRASRHGKPLATVSANASGCRQTYVQLAGRKEILALFETATVISLGERLLGVQL